MLTDKQKWILGGFIVVGGLAVYVQSSKRPFIKPTKIVYPPADGGSAYNRIYQNVENPAQLESLTISKTPLLLNFVRLGQPDSNKQTLALHDIVGKQMVKEKKAISMVSIESDGTENLPLLSRYGVSDIPSVVCLKKQLPEGRYYDSQLAEGEVKTEELTKWVREHADDWPN